MDFKKTIIIGSPGSGKTYFSNILEEKHNIKIYHLDDIFWSEDWKEMSMDEFNKKIKYIVNQDSWFIDGNFISTLNIRLNNCTHIIYMDKSLFKCLYQATKRILRIFFGEKHLLPKNIYKASKYKKQKSTDGYIKFMIYIIKFHLITKKELMNKIKKFTNVSIIKNNKDFENMIKKIGEWQKSLKK
ncbi:P-loop NTPase family protein [Tepidibacter thalassicus]|uniref:Adenylate kinase n=1 Tax=Tepidibacter thalassicus DSM 15285 TaxID=1123350 RepID=A0A1M5SXN7_9FIRM|nr:hypothetical protein [Tepidibacter thalassicus]SHH43140.1 hypothetical protein SAMN02744040_01951 [Tepidibacter thalassicus DSM 15285]